MAKTDKGNNFLKTVKNIISATNKKEKAALAADTVLKEAVKIFSKLNQPYAVITKANKIVGLSIFARYEPIFLRFML